MSEDSLMRTFENQIQEFHDKLQDEIVGKQSWTNDELIWLIYHRTLEWRRAWEYMRRGEVKEMDVWADKKEEEMNHGN